jgi:hypothetical protein
MECYVAGQPVARTVCELEGLLRVGRGPRVVAPPEGNDSQVGQDMGSAPIVSVLPIDLQRLIEDPGCPVELV